MASYILTASLSYALCPAGATRPVMPPSCSTKHFQKAHRPPLRASSTPFAISVCIHFSSHLTKKSLFSNPTPDPRYSCITRPSARPSPLSHGSKLRHTNGSPRQPMKSPGELAYRLARQWGKSRSPGRTIDRRRRLANQNTHRTTNRSNGCGGLAVGFTSYQGLESRAFRSGCLGIRNLPRHTRFHQHSNFLGNLQPRRMGRSCRIDRSVAARYSSLTRILSSSDPLFHPLFVGSARYGVTNLSRKFSRLQNLPRYWNLHVRVGLRFAHCHSPVSTASFSSAIGADPSPAGSPLRWRSQPARLEVFLGAWQESDHWLLVVDLDGGLLPFFEQRVRSSELLKVDVSVRHLLIVENERCLHLLPRAQPGTVVVLGAGNNLRWLAAPWVQRAQLGYWGDIDTWGLVLLASARSLVPHITAVLMSQRDYDKYADNDAVVEPVIAGPNPPNSLSPSEKALYLHLLTCRNGRIEQEFLSRSDVAESLADWLPSIDL